MKKYPKESKSDEEDIDLYSSKDKSKLIHALLESEARFKALSETAFEGIFITENGFCIDANLAGCKMFGYTLDELIGIYATDVVVPEFKDTAYKMMVNKSEDPYNVIIRRKDGSTFHAEVRGKNYTYKSKKETRVVIVRDITEYKKVTEELKISENKYRSVVEHAGDGILIGNLEGKMIDVNQGFLNITGYTKQEVINQHISIIFDNKSLTENPLNFKEVDAGNTVIMERYIISKTGESIPIEMNSTKPDNNYYLAIIRDLRERNQVKNALLESNKELISAKEKAEESDHLKSAFIENMSHEIRTPMNGIIGFAELLKNPTINPGTRKEYLDVIISSGQQLLDIINDILEISKIEAGQIDITLAPFSIANMFSELNIFFTSIAANNNNSILFITDNLSNDNLNSDRNKIQQVFTNLINNGLKFTSNGTIEISAETEGAATIFKVKDTGIGIQESDKKHIFDRFTQVNNTSLKKEKGTGLGLSICKKLVLMMGGKIWVDSKVDIGSTFYFQIPN